MDDKKGYMISQGLREDLTTRRTSTAVCFNCLPEICTTESWIGEEIGVICLYVYI